jgi:hypothetical protein
MHVCMYMYVCMYVYMLYVFMYIYMYVYQFREKSFHNQNWIWIQTIMSCLMKLYL